jgi:hypothetical protein
MQISKSKVIFACFVGVTLCTVGWSHAQQSPQVTSANEARGIPGYLDPHTGVFKAQTTSPPKATVAATDPPVIFRLIFNFQIQYNDQPSSNTTTCTVSIAPIGDTNGLFHTESATSVSPDGHSCQVTILAQWDLANAATDTVSIDYDIESFAAIQGTLQKLRSSSHSLASIPMLANGETTTQPTITVVI